MDRYQCPLVLGTPDNFYQVYIGDVSGYNTITYSNLSTGHYRIDGFPIPTNHQVVEIAGYNYPRVISTITLTVTEY